VNESSVAAMKDVLTDIQDGTFARDFMAEWEGGAETFARMRTEGRAEQIESVGRELRDLMPWISNPTVD
jgi:ketol-acid reductoisomerase